MERKGENANENQIIDLTLRPTTWQEYVGQERVKEQLQIMLEAAKRRGEACDHLLFYGQAGLGKTTLAHLVARELGANLKVTSGPSLEKVGDVAAVLTNLDKGDILFIDEAHRLNRVIEEVLYPAMEERKLNLIVGKGPSARTVALDLPAFTLIAATTRANLLSGPLRSRFGASFKLDYYDVASIRAILTRSAKILNVSVAPEAIATIAQASRFTPRVANRLLKRVRDYAEVHGTGGAAISDEMVGRTLDLLEIDSLGLEPYDRRLLRAIIEKFSGGPVGLATLAAALNDDKGNIEDVHEPFLMSIGLLARTPSGRVATDVAYEHLNIELPNARLL
jgi:Holliday junction DNA helicase RuvB